MFAAFGVGILLCLPVVLLVNAESRYRKRRRHSDWFSRTGGSEALFLKSAGIASDMAPLFDSLNLSGARITVVGGDGYYIVSRKSRHLSRAIRSWISSGASVDYVLLNPSELARSMFMQLARHLKSSNFDGALNIIIPDRDKPECLAALKEFDTHHPTIIETKEDGDAIWLEGLHPHGSMYAYNIWFLPPTAVSLDAHKGEIVSRYKQKIELLKECGRS